MRVHHLQWVVNYVTARLFSVTTPLQQGSESQSNAPLAALWQAKLSLHRRSTVGSTRSLHIPPAILSLLNLGSGSSSHSRILLFPCRWLFYHVMDVMNPELCDVGLLTVVSAPWNQKIVIVLSILSAFATGPASVVRLACLMPRKSLKPSTTALTLALISSYRSHACSIVDSFLGWRTLYCRLLVENAMQLWR